MDTVREYPETEHRETGGHRRHVLVAVDDSDASERVVSFVNEFFAGLDVEVVGINVGHEPAARIPTGLGPGASFYWPYMGELLVPDEDDYAASRQEAVRTVEASGLIDDDVVADIGDPVTHICDVAVERCVDLIVVGDNHKTGLRRLLGGSLTSDVQRRAPCPVLVVP